jgi:septal ring factor EnvC (AmiA/AmiB activator)
LRVLDEELDSASGSLVRAQDELLIKQAALRRRLVDIYKRGPLFSFEALLSAESFGELIARYKYLHTVALRDRALVHRTEQLRDTVAGKHELLLVLQSDKEVSRAQKSEEEQRLRTLEQQWQQRYDRTQRDRQTAQSAATRNAASTRRLNDEIAQFAAESRRTDTRPNVPVPVTGSMRPSDRNTLNWPVDGDIIFSFGRAQNPNNTTVRWTGMGIAATQGTPVKAVADGKVVAAAPISTYGNTVIIQHDGGFSTYGSLGRMNVGVGQIVTKGEVIGTVGVSNPELGSYLYFQMSDRDGHPVDPLEWLRDKQ